MDRRHGGRPLTARRPDGVTVHDWQHTLIDQRVGAWRSTPRRSGIDRIRSREAAKRAYWTLRGHLQSGHGIRDASPTALIDDLLRRHDRIHADMTPDPDLVAAYTALIEAAVDGRW